MCEREQGRGREVVTALRLDKGAIGALFSIEQVSSLAIKVTSKVTVKKLVYDGTLYP